MISNETIPAPKRPFEQGGSIPLDLAATIERNPRRVYITERALCGTFSVEEGSKMTGIWPIKVNFILA